MLANPFFVREIRHLADKSRWVQILLVTALGLMSAELLAWIYCHFRFGVQQPWYRELRGWFLAALLLTHGALCFLAGCYAGYRVFIMEHLRRTFEPLQLLPMGPGRWIWGKLTFPIFSYAAAVLAGVPFYYLAEGCGLMRVEAMGHFLQKFLLGGVVLLLVILLITPEYLQLQRQYQKTASSRTKSPPLRFTWWGILQAMMGFLAGMGLVFGQGLAANELPCFDSTIHEAWYWIIAIVAVAPASWLTAVAALRSDEKADARAARARHMAVLVLYTGILAGLWEMFPVWMRWGAILLIPLVVAYGSLTLDRKADDPASEAEVHWLKQHWDNALLVHDLRVFSRQRSIRKFAVLTSVWTGVAGAGLYGASQFLGAVSMLVFALTLGCFLFFQLAAACWAKSRLFWMKEWSEGTLPMLFLTPMTEREILLGRLAAVPIYFGLGCAPALALFSGLLLWLWVAEAWPSAPLIVAMSPLLLTLGLWTSIQLSPTGLRSAREIVGNWRHWMLRILQLLVIGEGVALAASRSESPALIHLAWFGALGVANLLLCRGWLELRIKQLQKVRRMDSDELARGRAGRRRFPEDKRTRPNHE